VHALNRAEPRVPYDEVCLFSDFVASSSSSLNSRLKSAICALRRHQRKAERSREEERVARHRKGASFATYSSSRNRHRPAARWPCDDESPLTRLLRDALGGNCRTALVATVSPAQRHATQTAATLAFAAACRRVRNTTCVNVARHHRRALVPTRDGAASAAARRPTRADANRAAARDAERLPWARVRPGDAACPGGRSELGGASCFVQRCRATSGFVSPRRGRDGVTVSRSEVSRASCTARPRAPPRPPSCCTGTRPR